MPIRVKELQKAENKPLLRHKGLKDFGTHIKYENTLFEYIHTKYTMYKKIQRAFPLMKFS